MDLLSEYRSAQEHEQLARLRRIFALRALTATGLSQRDLASTLGVSQPAISQQLRSAGPTVHPKLLLDAATPILKAVSAAQGYTRLAVFGSVARGEAGAQSDLDLLIQPPPGTSSFDFIRFKALLEKILHCNVDLVSYGGLSPELDADIQRDAVLL